MHTFASLKSCTYHPVNYIGLQKCWSNISLMIQDAALMNQVDFKLFTS